MDNAIKAIRKDVLAALEKGSNKVLSLFPNADSDPQTAQLVFNIIGSQAHEALDLFLRQFAVDLDQALGNAWLEKANAEIDSVIKEMEAEK